MTIPIPKMRVGDKQMQARMPNAKLVMFEGYGHGINLLILERCVAEMRAFSGQPAAV